MDEQGREHVEELDLEPVANVQVRRRQALWAVLAAVGLIAGGLVVSSSNDGEQRPGLPVDLAGASRAFAGEAAADSMLAWVTYVRGDDLPALGGEATAYRLSGEVTEAQVRELADELGLDGEVVRGDEGSWLVTGDGEQGRLDVHAGGGAYWSYYSGDSGCVAEDGGGVSCSFSEIGGCIAPPDAPSDCDASTGYGVSGSSGSSRSATAAACDGDLPISPECTVTTVVEDVCCLDVQPDEPTATTYPEECLVTGACAANVCPGAEGNYAPTCPPRTCVKPAEPPCLVEEPPGLAPDLPSEDEARQIALDVVAAGGAAVEGARVTADQAYYWYITVEPVVDGIPSGLVAYVEVGSDGQVVSGNGFMGQPEALGEYPLLDTRSAIDRANQQSSGTGIEPGLGAPDAMSETGGGAGDVGGTTGDTRAPVTTVVGTVDPCVAPDGASEDCGGATDCSGDGCVAPSTTIQCTPEANGTAICEVDGVARCVQPLPYPGDPDWCSEFACLQPVPGEAPAVGAPEEVDCPAPDPGVEPIPLPEPQPIEIVLVDAEPSLVLLPATDGSTDVYLVPAYRFTAEDGGTVDLPAVANDALAGSGTTETTVPATDPPEPVPVPEPQPCEVLEEEDASGTTHTVQTCPTPGDDPVVGANHVDAFVQDDHCTWLVVKLGGKVWWTPDYYEDDLYGWSQPTEPGTFTIHEDGTGDFVADADPERVATLVPWEQGPDGPMCA